MRTRTGGGGEGGGGDGSARAYRTQCDMRINNSQNVAGSGPGPADGRVCACIWCLAGGGGGRRNVTMFRLVMCASALVLRGRAHVQQTRACMHSGLATANSVAIANIWYTHKDAQLAERAKKNNDYKRTYTLERAKSAQVLCTLFQSI